MFTGTEVVAILEELGVTHVIWVPDSAMGVWEAALESSPRMKLVRVCREGEAWPLAAGLHLGGQSPIILLQTTGLFESGDALRNILFDLKLPIYALVGVRNGLAPQSRDSAKLFAEPMIRAWGIDVVRIREPAEIHLLTDHFRACRAANRPGMALLAEEPM
ncbi:MAG TPA: thiamine pyrophosphate-binding protein [Pirellulaceae bacterium]|jgi:sulfopyruvate decarboxylase TPP-binding subunit